MHQALQGATFHVEHIVPKCRGGDSNLDNLAWACPTCNLHKADRVDAADPQTGRAVPLFHPRRERWSRHFRWEGHEIMPLTATGRATSALLKLNHPRRVQIRRAEELFELFPPDED
jgi:hypothetical protein